MPFNVLLTFLIGGVLGCVVVKITKPPSHLRGLVLGSCAAGNLGNLLLIIIPAICQEKGSPFGDPDICVTYGMAYVSFSMAVGAIYIWSFVYNIVRISSESHQGTQSESWKKESVPPTEYVDVGILSSLLPRAPAEMPISTATNGSTEKNGCNDVVVSLESKDFSEDLGKDKTIQCRLKKLTKSLHLQEIMVPPTIATSWNYSIHYPDSWRELNKRSTQFRNETLNHFRNCPCAFFDTSINWCICTERSILFWDGEVRSIVPLHIADTVCTATCYEYGNNDTAIWQWRKRLLGYFPVDLLISKCSPHRVGNHIYVDSNLDKFRSVQLYIRNYGAFN